MTDQERINKTREKLNKLKQSGYNYIVADENGDYWKGHKDSGLVIDEVIESAFQGEIHIESST